jgi:SAM-dependent methyltransferase
LPGYFTRAGARFVHSTSLIDRLYQRFDRLRSLLVLAYASDDFLAAHCQLAYDASAFYRADSPDFRRELFPWERAIVEKSFPAPPARVLVGGAGGGREAYALIKMGYDVVAFEPAPELVATMRARSKVEYPTLEAYRAGYEDLPVMPAEDGEAPVDLQQQATFDAAILGWCSLSHLVDDSARSQAIAKMAALTRGPVLVSYFPDRAGPSVVAGRGGLLNGLQRRALRRGKAIFTTGVGYARLLNEAEFRNIAERAGVEIVHIEGDTDWPHAIVRRSVPLPPRRSTPRPSGHTQ